MVTPLLPTEQVLVEVNANRAGAAISKGGKLILTNLRLLFEEGALGFRAKLETEIYLRDIEGYRKSFTSTIATGMIAVPNAIDIVTNTEVYKFTINKRDGFLQQLANAAPHIQNLPEENYTETIVSLGSRMVSNVKKAVNNQPVPSGQQNAPQTQVASSIICPHCAAVNQVTAKFCNSCGSKLQLECPKCGTPVMQNMKFCSECGAQIQQQE